MIKLLIVISNYENDNDNENEIDDEKKNNDEMINIQYD